MPSEYFYREILKWQHVEYAACDAARRVYDYSPGLLQWVKRLSGPLRGRKLEDLFDELAGTESDLEQILLGHVPSLHIHKIHRVLLHGRDGFLSLSIVPFAPGLLLMVTDVSAEGRIEQRVTQQRNELDLLAAQLAVERTTLEDLFRRFVPKAVANRAIANPQAVRVGGERRVISVLFADMRGYTTLVNDYAPAEFMALLNEHYAALGNVIGARGGTLSQHVGDMLIALFNAPEEQPDHALRATQAALEARAALRVLQANAQVKVQFGMAVNTGVAIVGYLGYEEQLDYSAIGDVTNLAARLSGLAQGEQVLLGPTTHEIVRSHIATREFGSVQVKGHATPLLVYEAVEAFQ